MWNMDHSIASAERGEREARSTNLTNASLQQTSGLTRPAGLVLVDSQIFRWISSDLLLKSLWDLTPIENSKKNYRKECFYC